MRHPGGGRNPAPYLSAVAPFDHPRASNRGTPADGRFRATQIAVRRNGRWLLAGVHLSRIGGPPPFARPSA